MAQLEIQTIAVTLGGVEILKDVSLDVAEGECVSLLGPSGCGKTTTLRAIAGFVEVDRGDVKIGDKSVLGLPPHRRNIGLVFQDYALFPHMTVVENIAYGLTMRRLRKSEIEERVSNILELVQLGDMGERYPGQMSGGQRQRVALARALVIQPDVLLLDEPLGALDRKLRDQMQVEFKRIQRESGVTTIFVTHDQEEALSLSDRVAVMFEGRITEIGRPLELYRRPNSRAVMEFLGASNTVVGDVVAVEDGGATVLTEDGLSLTTASTGLQIGQSARLGIRPENIELATDAPASAQNVVPGIVEELVYKGTHSEIYVRTHGGEVFSVYAPDGAGAAADDVRIGAAVQLVFSRTSVLVLR